MHLRTLWAIAPLVFYAAANGYAVSAAPSFPTIDDALPPGILLEEEKAIPPPGFKYREIYERGLAFTKASEGWVPRLYDDAAGYCTIGYGHLIKKSACDGSEDAQFRGTISDELGTKLLVDDMKQAELAVLTMVKITLTDGQYAALCDFVFNVGSNNFKNSTLLKLVNKNQFDQVPDQFNRWVMANHKTYLGLVKRRAGEITLFFDGGTIPKAVPPVGEDLSPLDIMGN